MNYTELKTSIQFWLNNYSTELSGQLDQIIRNAEARLVREVDLREYRRHGTASTTPNDPYLSLPSNVLQVRYLRIRTGNYIEYRPESFMAEYNQTVTTAGTPKYYGHWDDATVVMAPAPNGAITVELSYKIKPTSIVSATTTWLGDNAEDALLYACCVEAGIALQLTPDLLAPYMARYSEAKESLQKQESSNSSDEYMARSTV